MAAIEQAEIIWSTERLSGTIHVSGAQYIAGGWISGTAVTQTFPTSNDRYFSVYLMSSGSAAPPSAKFVDGLAGITLATLILPTANGSSVNLLGPGISGVNVANTIGYFNTYPSTLGRIEVQNNAASGTAYRIIIVGR